MYFENRIEAGNKLAEMVAKMIKNDKAVVVALSSGAVIVGEQIANRLDCPMSMILSEEITLPREPLPIGGITENGTFSYNSDYSNIEIKEFITEYHGIIEQDKLAKLRKLNRDVAGSEVLSASLLANRNIILVSDGLAGGFVLNLAFDYLKPINHKKVIVATPFANVPAIDKVHIMADMVACINVIDNFISVDHYYDNPISISRTEAVSRVGDSVKQWIGSRKLTELDELRNSSIKNPIFTK